MFKMPVLGCYIAGYIITPYEIKTRRLVNINIRIPWNNVS